MATATNTLHGGSYITPALESATVADAMRPGILACDPGASVRELARMMVSQHIHCLALIGVSRDAGGESLAWRIVTDIDLVAAGVHGDTARTAEEVAGEPIVGIESTMALREAGELMLSTGVSHLLVIDPETQRPVGVLSTQDIVGVIAWGEG
ncbi:MAG TPA: CBS domain-containing protein [Solirubrobacteraceae bacterium]|jgi:CBS domain-containing protein